MANLLRRRSLKVLLLLLLGMQSLRLEAQVFPPPVDSLPPACMIVLPDASNPPDFTVPMISVPMALQTCSPSGRIQAYFVEVDSSLGTGFDDPTGITGGGPTLGSVRRNCVCAVLAYLEDSVLDLDPSITSTNPLIIKFGNPSTVNFFGVQAITTPNYPLNTPGYHHSYMGNAIINGGANLGSTFGGTIFVNFSLPNNRSYNYCGYPYDNCGVDFYSLILHEVTHLLGFCSGVDMDVTGSSPVLNFPLGTSTFTEWDNQFLYYYDAGSSTFIKIISGSTPGLTSPLNATTLATSVNSVWLTNNSLSTSRDNQPIYDRHYDDITTNMAFHHFEEHFPRANYKSPGFLAPYVVGARYPTDEYGIARRRYSMQELRVLTQLGFTIRSGYSDFPKISNNPPLTLGQIIDPDPSVWGIDHHRVQTPPAGNSDLYISTTTCEPVTIALNDGTGVISGFDPVTGTRPSHSMGLSDLDGDSLFVYDRQLWNINGCGSDPTNPSPLTLSTAGDFITFTPRDNFVGRANFAFHLGDGKERGSFIVVTVDVTRDCGCWADPCEMVVNGSFENGTDYNRHDPSLRFALKCPMLEGPAIYQARALLRILSGNIIIYRDTCLAQGGVEGHNEEGNNQRNWIGGKGIIQQYRLIPNPNDGQICLSQAIKDDMPVNIKVFNAIGAVVYSSEKRIEARAAFIDLSALAPGVYNMVLRDSNGDDYKLKFVKR